MSNNIYLALNYNNQVFAIDASKYAELDDMYKEAHDCGGSILCKITRDLTFKLIELLNISTREVSEKEDYFIERRLHRDDIKSIYPRRYHNAIDRIDDAEMRYIAEKLGECNDQYWEAMKDLSYDSVKEHLDEVEEND